MATATPVLSLDTYIAHLADALAQERTARLTQLDLAYQILTLYGPSGLRQAAQTLGLTRGTLGRYAMLGRLFPASVRRQWPMLRYSHYREAVAAARLFSEGPSADPVWWADQAAMNGWSSEELRRRAHYYVPVSPERGATAQDMVQRATRVALQGQRQVIHLEALVAQYNRRYAPVTGVALTLQKTVYGAPASV